MDEVVKAKLAVVANKAGDAKLTPEDAKAILAVLAEYEQTVKTSKDETAAEREARVKAETTRDQMAHAYASQITEVDNLRVATRAIELDVQAWKKRYEDLRKMALVWKENGRRIPENASF